MSWEVVAAPKWLGRIRARFPVHRARALPRGRGGSGRYGWLPSALACTAVAYLVVAFIGIDTSGGKSLGPRLLMPLLPLLTVSAMMRIAKYLRSALAWTAPSDGRRRARPLCRRDPHARHACRPTTFATDEDARAVLAAAAAPERIIVADDPVHGAVAVSALLPEDHPACRDRRGWRADRSDVDRSPGDYRARRVTRRRAR